MRTFAPGDFAQEIPTDSVDGRLVDRDPAPHPVPEPFEKDAAELHEVIHRLPVGESPHLGKPERLSIWKIVIHGWMPAAHSESTSVVEVEAALVRLPASGKILTQPGEKRSLSAQDWP